MKAMTPWRTRKMIKKMINSNKESKRVDYSHGRLSLYHNGGASVTPLTWTIMASSATTGVWAPTQGDGDGNRDGNDIYVQGMTLRMQFNLPADRLNTKIRCIIVKVPRGYSVASYTNVMDSVTGNAMIDPVDKDRVKVVKQFFVGQKAFNPMNGSTGKEITLYRKIYMPVKRVVKFNDDGSEANFLEWDYHLLMWGYDTYGTLPGDIVGYCQLWTRCHFKDK